MLTVSLLILSIVLSAGRNIFSKSISEIPWGTKSFFRTQAVIFLSGGVILGILAIKSFDKISNITVFYALIYAVLLLSAQWNYTIALRTGKVGICSTVYSFGFILPALSGVCFWGESINYYNIFGILSVIAAIVLSGTHGGMRSETGNGGYFFPLISAMLSSGGLGIMQKVQQSSPFPDQRNAFLFIAFVAAGIVSFIISLFFDDKKIQSALNIKKLSPCCIGAAFGICNNLNTFLAGRLNSAVFFPVLNIGTIIFSLLSGVIIFNDKLRTKDIAVLCLGAAAIILFTL